MINPCTRESSTRRLLLLALLITLDLSPALGSSGNKAEVQSILREASHSVPEIEEMQLPSAAANVAGLQVRAGDLEGAIATAEIPTKESDRSLVASSIVYALVDRGEVPVALRFIADFSRAGDKTSSYVQMALLLIQKRKFDDALTATRLIPRDPGHGSIFVDTLMRVYAAEWKAGERVAAGQLLDEAIRRADSERRNLAVARFEVAGMYQSIAARLIEAGEPDAAPAMLPRIAEMAQSEKDPVQKAYLIRDLAMAQTLVGATTEALRTTARLTPGNDRDSALFGVATELVKQGEREEALKVANTISSEVLRERCKQEIAYQVSSSGNYSGGLAILEASPQQGQNAYGLAELALQQAQKQDPAASNSVELAWRATQNISGKDRDDALRLIAVTRGVLGDIDGALAVAEALGPEERVWPLWNLTEMMVLAGKKQEALELARRQGAPQPKTYGLLGVAKALLDQAEEKRITFPDSIR